MEIMSRIKEIIGYLNISEREFASSIGAGQRSVNYYLKGEQRPNLDFISKIIASYPEINTEWLITGKGLMLKKDDMSITNIYNPKVPEEPDDRTIPLYDIDAAANLKTMFENKTQNIIGVLSIPNIPKSDGAMFIRGDSMYPILKSGDIVVFKIVNDLSFVIPGEMYVVNYTWDDDEYVVVKYVNKSDIPDHYKLVSYNQHFEPMDIPISSIRAMALVKVSVRYNTVK